MSYQKTRHSLRMPPAETNEAHRSYHEEKLFEAVVTAGAIVAFADGQVDASERSELVNFVEQSRWLPTITPIEAADAFDSRMRQFEIAQTVPEGAISSLQQVGDGVGIDEVVAAAEQVARADGLLQPSEVEALKRVRSAMNPSHDRSRNGTDEDFHGPE